MQIIYRENLSSQILTDIKKLTEEVNSSFLVLSTEKDCWDLKADLKYKNELIISPIEAKKTFTKTFFDLDVFSPELKVSYEMFDGFDNHFSNPYNDKIMYSLSEKILENLNLDN